MPTLPTVQELLAGQLRQRGRGCRGRLQRDPRRPLRLLLQPPGPRRLPGPQPDRAHAAVRRPQHRQRRPHEEVSPEDRLLRQLHPHLGVQHPQHQAGVHQGNRRQFLN